jgi:hypothetical protein
MHPPSNKATPTHANLDDAIFASKPGADGRFRREIDQSGR